MSGVSLVSLFSNSLLIQNPKELHSKEEASPKKLMQAILDKNKESIKDCLTKEIDPNCEVNLKDFRDQEPVYLTFNSEGSSYARSRSRTADLMQDERCTPLLLALGIGDKEIISLIIELGGRAQKIPSSFLSALDKEMIDLINEASVKRIGIKVGEVFFAKEEILLIIGEYLHRTLKKDIFNDIAYWERDF